MARVALIPGDGIGTEVVAEAARVLETADRLYELGVETEEWSLGAERFLAEGVTITEEEFRRLADDFDAILLGAMGDPRVPGNQHARDILLGLRFRLDLYVNHRPCHLLDPAHSPLRPEIAGEMRIDFFRENTEGVYTGVGGNFKEGTADEVAFEEDVNTRKGVERIIRAAFEFARTEGRDRVTLVDKANAMTHVGALWRRTFEDVATEFSGIDTDRMYVDAMAMDLVRRPGRYQVVVTSNLFGDILSDLGAELSGGLGMAPSANVHPGSHALFEPVHGSAPDIAGQGRANPIGAIRCVGMLLDHLGHPDAGREVEAAVRTVVQSGRTTEDLGGDLDTAAVGTAVVEELEASVAKSRGLGATVPGT